MPLRTKTPGDGGKQRRVHFVHVPTKNNQTWHAHVAGPCHWYECHTKGRTKPCLHWLTQGQIVCERCASTAPPEDIGYQPLYRELDGRPCFVVVHDYARDLIDALKLHQRVVVGRGAEQSDGVWITAALNPRPLYETRRAEFLRPADLTETLLRVWGLPELTDWYDRTQRASDNTVSLPKGTALKPDGKPFAPHMQAAAKRNGFDVVPDDDEPGDVNRIALERVMGRIPPANGNGKPKPKG
jgi:hypothetical protein